MTTTSQPAMSVETLIDLAHADGIRVYWRDLGHLAHWSARHRCIWLHPDLTEREARSLLAHELGHAHHGDAGPQPAHIEARAWRYAATLLIDPAEYALAEHTHGPRKDAIADALDVTREVITGYQSLLTLKRSA